MLRQCQAALTRGACLPAWLLQEAGQAHQADYTSDSGRSEAGALPRRQAAAPSRRNKNSMTGATELHTECRPSMLSADRIALTQHSGVRYCSPGPAMLIAA